MIYVGAICHLGLRKIVRTKHCLSLLRLSARHRLCRNASYTKVPLARNLNLGSLWQLAS